MRRGAFNLTKPNQKSAAKAPKKAAKAPKSATKAPIKATKAPIKAAKAPIKAAKAPKKATKAPQVAKAPKAAAKPAAKSAPAKSAAKVAKSPPAKASKAPPPKPAPVKSAPTGAGRNGESKKRPANRNTAKGMEFKTGDHVVYPTHGVGLVRGIEKEQIGGHSLKLIVVTFERDRMTLRVPMDKMESSGLRRLSSRRVIDSAMMTLKGRARVKRTMWSRRAQEYEAKINSGDPISIAEVVRDLHRNVGQPEQSFSERQIYESALERLASEVAAVESIDMDTAT